MDAPVLCEIRDSAAYITLNQPEKRNALTDDLIHGLLQHLNAALVDESVRAIVLTGAGPSFCAGADLKGGGIKQADGENPFVTVMKTLWNSPKPVLGRINGHAFGGGIGLAAACDLTIAADSAAFSFSEVRIGVIPAMISVVVLPKLGIQNAMWLFLTGERFDAHRAVELGLIHRAVPADQLDSAIAETLHMIRQGGPNAMAAAKRLVREIPGLPMEDAFRHTSNLIAELFTSPEALEGMTAFAEKRKPRWAS